MKLNPVLLTVFCLTALFASPSYAQSTGQDTYKSKCMMCHGPDGAGNTPAGKLAKIVSYKDPSIVNKPDADLIAIIKTGKNKMPAFATKLSDDQMQAVVDYIRTLQK
jgi:mono/diheme cytochrome c family protein